MSIVDILEFLLTLKLTHMIHIYLAWRQSRDTFDEG